MHPSLTLRTIVMLRRIVTARSTLSGCGDGGEVLTTNSINHNGNTISSVSGTCPQATSNSTKRDAIEERQNICTNGGCEGYPDLSFREELLDQQ
jgi:hypothetical protein